MKHYADEIFDMINASDKHLTAEQIFFEIKKAEPKIVLASVYNNLKKLTEKGLVRKISLDGEADRYDKIKRHDHIICKSCGRLADFDFGDLTAGLKSKLNSDVFKYDLKVFYECPDCKNKQ